MGRKKEALSQFHKGNILACAEKLFLEKGVQQTTMDDIAKSAEYSKATLYAYFMSKEDIYHHIIFEHMQELKDILNRNFISECDIEDSFYSACEEVAKQAFQNALFLKSITGNIAVGEESGKSLPILKDIYQIGEDINGVFLKYIENGINQNVFCSDIYPLETSFSLWSAISGVIIVAADKKEYFENCCGLNINEYLMHSFRLLWRMVAL